jgi:uncharacterized protein YfaP (DUF2135 family)
VYAAGGTTSVLASDVPVGTYYIRVRARNAFGASAPSNEATLVVGAGECGSALTASLTWNTGTQTGTPTFVDMDLHATEPDGSHVWGGNAAGPTLHVVNDNTTGLGPETICAPVAVANGVYSLDVSAFDGDEWPTTATLSVTTAAGTVSFSRVFTGPDDRTAQRVATVTFPGGHVTHVSGTTALDVQAAADTRIQR